MATTINQGMTGPEVKRLQQELGRQGYRVQQDGRFGATTWFAVRKFQRARGLPVDGIAGPSTLTALSIAEPDSPESDVRAAEPAEGQQGNAISLHIGLNSVNAAEYGGWSGMLQGCERDAQTMQQIAKAEGFATSILLTRNATSSNVLAAIENAAEGLTTGGTFLLTYAGHGGQVPDLNSAEDEVDNKDETWVLWNRMLLDDELSQSFTAFAPGVMIILLSDSCHSGTIYRAQDGLQQLQDAVAKRDFYRNLSVGGDAHPGAVPRPGPLDADGGQGGVLTRELPYEINNLVVIENSQTYRDIQAEARSRAQVVVASGLSISGCADNQLSQEVGQGCSVLLYAER